MKIRPLGLSAKGLKLDIQVIGHGQFSYLRCAVIGKDGEDICLFSENSGNQISQRFIKMGERLNPKKERQK